MTDSENSAPQDDSDEDIYDDFPEFNFEDELAKLEGSKESYKQEAQDLSDRVKKLSEENEELKKSNEVLKKNLSTLLKTAQTEIQRKDAVINELREKVESFTFRRKNKATKDKFTTTEDLPVSPDGKRDSRSRSKKNRSRSRESRTDSDGEIKCAKEEKKKREKSSEREVKEEKKKRERSSEREFNDTCDGNKRLGHFRDISKPSFKHSNNIYDDPRERHKGSRFHRFRSKDFQDSRSFRYSHRDHLKYDSLDKKRHSDGSSYPFRRKDSRERRRDSTPERKRKEVRRDRSRSCERFSGNKDSPSQKHRSGRSRSRERSSGNKESPCQKHRPGRSRSAERQESKNSPEKHRTKYFNKELCKTKEHSSKGTESETVKESAKNEEKSEKLEKVVEDSDKGDGKSSKSSKVSTKGEKKKHVDIFQTKSPLEALYSEPVTTRDTIKCFNSGITIENEVEEGECTENEPEIFPQEDWRLSFKNERKPTAPPMTLYSKRMLQRLKSEKLKKEEQNIVENEGETYEETPKSSKVDKAEKEPGELTDDENIVESSKEFQELTKVASIHNNTSDKSINAIDESPKEESPKESPKEENLFKEPIQREVFKKNVKKTATKTDKKYVDVFSVTTSSKEIESAKEIGDAIEFSPFKNNYKLIEISPIKLPGNERLMDLYNKGIPPLKTQAQKEVESSIFNFLSSLVPPDKRDTIPKITKSEEKNPMPSSKLSQKEPEHLKEANDVSKKEPNELGKKELDKLSKKESNELGKKELDKLSKKESNEVSEKEVNEPSKKEVSKKKSKEVNEPSKKEQNKKELKELNKKEQKKLDESNKKELKETMKKDVDKLSKSEKVDKKSVEEPGRKKPVKETSPCETVKAQKKEKTDVNKKEAVSKQKKSSKVTEEKTQPDDENLGRGKRRSLRKEISKEVNDKQQKESEVKEDKKQEGKKRKREENDLENKTKKPKVVERRESRRTRSRSKTVSNSEPDSTPDQEKVKEDISFFEFFKPIAEKDKPEKNCVDGAADYKMTTTMSLTEVVCLETPSKGVEKLKNLMINEQMICRVVDSRSGPFSPIIASKCVEMTPRRMLKNDLMLTDSEDESGARQDSQEDESGARQNGQEDESGTKQEVQEKLETKQEVEDEDSESEYSELDSDSGASDFVDLL